MIINSLKRRVAAALRPESDAFLHLDVLRFMAAAGIVFFHFTINMPALHEAVMGLRFLVDLFFVISGFVMASVYGVRVGSVAAYKDFMLRRVARLLPLHWATLLFYVLVLVLSGVIGMPVKDPARYDMACVAPNLLLLHAFGVCDALTFNFVSWSLSAEMGMYALLPLFVLLARRAWALPLLMFAALALYGVLQNPANPWYEWTFDGGVLRALPAFIYGMILHHARGWLARLPYASALTFGLAALFFVLLPLVDGAPLVLLMYAIPTLAVAADTRGVAPAWVRRTAGMGQLTYSIYMVHPVVYTVTQTVLAERVLHLQGAALTVWTVVAMLAVVPVAVASLVYFETPLRRRIARLGKN